MVDCNIRLLLIDVAVLGDSNSSKQQHQRFQLAASWHQFEAAIMAKANAIISDDWD
jgi:hypothetical protein